MSRTPWPGYITTKAADLPKRCPALYDSVPTRTSESGGITRLTCAKCGWTEAYLVTDRI